MISQSMLKLFAKKLENIKNSQLASIESKQPILLSAAANLKNISIPHANNNISNLNIQKQPASQSTQSQPVKKSQKTIVSQQENERPRIIAEKNYTIDQEKTKQIKDLSHFNILRFPVKTTKIVEPEPNQHKNKQSIQKNIDESSKRTKQINPTMTNQKLQMVATDRKSRDKVSNEDQKHYVSLQTFFDDNYQQVNYNRRHNLIERTNYKETQILINENIQVKKTGQKLEQKYRANLIQIDSDPQQQIIVSPQPQSTQRQEEKKQINFKQEQKKNVEMLPYVYMINNLISIYEKVPAKIIKLYIQQLAKKHSLPFNKVLIYYGIQQIIHQFYKTHQIQCSLYERYVFSKLEQLLPQFVSNISISNWFIIRRIAQGLSNRFQIRQFYSDQWLMSVIKKKKKMLKQGGVDLELTLSMAKRTETAAMNAVKEEPSPEQAKSSGYSNLKDYLEKNKQYSRIQSQLEQPSSQILDCSEKLGISNKLRYYKKLVQKQTVQPESNSVQMSEKNQQGGKKQNSQSTIQLLSIEIVKIRCQIPSNVQILSDYQQPQTRQLDNSDHQTLNKKDRKIQKFEQKQRKEKPQNNRSFVNDLLILNPTRIVKTTQQFTSEFRAKQSNSNNISNKNIKSSKQNEFRVRKTSTCVSKQIKQTIIHKQNKKVSDEVVDKMDKILYEFFLRQPDFTMKALLIQMQRALKQELKVAQHLHGEITEEWFNRYKMQQLDKK